jgi:hypothetical protein
MPGRRKDIGEGATVVTHVYLTVQVWSFQIISMRESTTLNTPVPHEVNYPRQAQQIKRVHKAPKLPPRELDRILQM